MEKLINVVSWCLMMLNGCLCWLVMLSDDGKEWWWLIMMVMIVTVMANGA